jgi:hypothetical protein
MSPFLSQILASRTYKMYFQNNHRTIILHILERVNFVVPSFDFHFYVLINYFYRPLHAPRPGDALLLLDLCKPQNGHSFLYERDLSFTYYGIENRKPDALLSWPIIIYRQLSYYYDDCMLYEHYKIPKKY